MADWQRDWRGMPWASKSATTAPLGWWLNLLTEVSGKKFLATNGIFCSSLEKITTKSSKMRFQYWEKVRVSFNLWPFFGNDYGHAHNLRFSEFLTRKTSTGTVFRFFVLSFVALIFRFSPLLAGVLAIEQTLLVMEVSLSVREIAFLGKATTSHSFHYKTLVFLYVTLAWFTESLSLAHNLQDLAPLHRLIIKSYQK